MLDIKLIRKKPEWVQERLATRHSGENNLIQELLSYDETRRKLLTEVEQLKSQRNQTSKTIGTRKAEGENVDELMAQMKEISLQIGHFDREIDEVESKQRNLLLMLPNLPSDSVPVGPDTTANRIEKQVGSPTSFDFEPWDHQRLGIHRGWLDFERTAKIAGSGFVSFWGEGARLERSLIQYLLDVHTLQHGYTEISPPFLVRETSMIGTGQLPKFEEDMYALSDGRLYLIPTAEVPLTNLHREEILDSSQLPLAYAAYTPCFRQEAGSAGKDTRGLTRMHQFDKVELVHIVSPENSYAILEKLLSHVEHVLKSLELTYRVVSLCTGDLGFGAAKCYDLEVWAPASKTWLEVSSCSHFEDFQARRMNLRFKNKQGENTFCHTLNGSGPALARLYVALLETHQQADQSVRIPPALHRYVGKECL